MMNSDLQNRLYDFEADPPKEVWGKINDALDAEQTFPQRLFEYEQTPPLHAWDKIEASLENENKTFKVVPFTKFKKPVRYLAVAASILAAVFIINRFSDNKSEAGAAISGSTTTISPNQSSILPSTNAPVQAQINKEEDIENIASTSNNKNTETQHRRTLASIRTQAVIPLLSLREKFIPGKANKESFFDFSGLDNYMVYSDGNGTALKVPKKLFSLVNCKDGDDSCKERLQQLQQKLAASATTTDFVGILEILRQLQ